MQFMVAFTPKSEFVEQGYPADFPDRELDEQAQVKVLYADERLRQIWAFDTTERGGMCLFEVSSREHLEQTIHTFPLVALDYCDYQVFPLAPYPAFRPDH